MNCEKYTLCIHCNSPTSCFGISQHFRVYLHWEFINIVIQKNRFIHRTSRWAWVSLKSWHRTVKNTTFVFIVIRPRAVLASQHFRVYLSPCIGNSLTCHSKETAEASFVEFDWKQLEVRVFNWEQGVYVSPITWQM